jgi:hypothetical protein
MTVQTASPARAALRIRPRSALIGGLGAVLLLISPLGVGWFYVPAVPQAHIPATTLSYQGLHHLAGSGMAPTNWVQQNYFAWLGWLLIVAAILITGAAVVTGRRALDMAGAALCLLGLVLGLFAAKGALSWSQFAHELSNLRVGAYLLVAGFFIILVSALIPEAD